MTAEAKRIEIEWEKTLAREDVLKLIEEHGGPAGLDLSGRNLKGIDLSGEIYKLLDLHGINLSGSNLHEADLRLVNLSQADLSQADLSSANLYRADLTLANLSSANLYRTALTQANLSSANLIETNLFQANLGQANLRQANLESAQIGWTIFGDVDLSVAKGLDIVKHKGPSTIGIDTLQKSKGYIPEDFLRDCGSSPWEIEIARLYDPALTPGEISEILDVNIFRKRTDGPLYIGGIFISYSHVDSKFVDKLYGELKNSGAAVWLDRHDLVAGPLKEQIIRSLRIRDIVIVVLSNNSIDSDWVENEVKMARKKEKDENRNILCPIALDESWKAKVDGDVLWGQLEKKNILDFSAWKTRKFSNQYRKLLDGIKIYYK